MASYTYFAVELGDEHALGCKCCRFSKGDDLPIPKKLTDHEIGGLARRFSHQIFQDFTQLNAILKRYEEVVQRRWMRKNDRKRRAVLLGAWPEMAPTHRPDFVGFRKAFKNSPRSRTMLSKSYLWPYINLEDLAQRHLLLLFVNSRGRNLPDKFISADIEAAHLGKGWHFYGEQDDGPVVHVDPEKHKNGVTVMSLHGSHGPGSYGKLSVCDGSEPLTKSAFMYHPSLGLLGLEIQQGIYRFVLDCVKLVLHDVEPDQFFLAPHAPTPLMPQQKGGDYESFSAQALEAPYRVPQMLDLKRINNLVSARKSAAEDHLWLLREDPGYFHDTLEDWKAHDTITVKHSCSHCYNMVAAKMISDAYTYFILWSQISVGLEHLPPLHDQIKRANTEYLRLPPQEEAIWAEILEIIDFLIYEPITALRMGVPPSPRLRHCFDLPDNTSPDKRSCPWSTKAKISDAERRVTGLVFAIVDADQRHLHSLNRIIQEFQYMMETDKASAELVDPWINSQFADLALLSELKLCIEGLQPWQTAWKARKIHKTNPVKQRLETLVRIVELDIRDCIYCIALELGFDLLNSPLGDRLDYPASKAYTKENVKQMRRAEKALDQFWKQLDGDLEATSGSAVNAFVESRMSGVREKHRTPPWKEPKKLIDTPKAKPALRELDTNVAIPHAASSSKPAISLPTPKNKIKTRGIPSSPVTAEPAPDPPTPDVEDSAVPPSSTIKVSRRAFRVLDALIPAPNSASHQRAEIAWTDLLSALDEIGLAPEKLYGSVWVFKPREGPGACKVEVSRSISFHEPKEVRRGHKIPTNMVRTFGRRLKHAYGWVGGMFVIE